MIDFLKTFLLPFSVVKRQPHHFCGWLIGTVLIGTLPFWLAIISFALDGSFNKINFQRLIGSGVLLSFGFVLVSEGLSTTLSFAGVGGNAAAKGIRTSVYGLVITLIIILTVIFNKEISMPENTVAWQIHFMAVIVSIVMAAYLYCFRFNIWEKSLEEVGILAEQENDDIDELSSKIDNQTVDIDEGIEL